MWTFTVAAQIFAFAAFTQVGSACMFATFGYDPCSGKVIGSIEDNGNYYGQILEQTSMDQIFKPKGILISLTPTLRDQGYGAYVHEVRSEDGKLGYLSHVTIHQGADGHEVGGFELVKDKNGHYSNAVYGCEELDDMSWFKRKPEYGGRGGWDRWGGDYPKFDINAAWTQCVGEPERSVRFQFITAETPVPTSGTEADIAVGEGGRGGNQGYREHQNKKKSAALVTITRTKIVTQAKETGIRGGNQGYRAPLPVPRGGNQGYRAYGKREPDAEETTFLPVKLVNAVTQTVISYATRASRLMPHPAETAPVVGAQDNTKGGAQGFKGPMESSPSQAEWQERVAQEHSGSGVMKDTRSAKREVEKRELSEEEIKAMQDRDSLRRPQVDKMQSRRNIPAANVQGKSTIKRAVPTPERSAKIKHSDFARLERPMDVLAQGVTHDVDYVAGPDAYRKAEANPTSVSVPDALTGNFVQKMQKIHGRQAGQWAQKRDPAAHVVALASWKLEKLKQDKLAGRAMETAPKGPKETDDRRYHTTAW